MEKEDNEIELLDRSSGRTALSHQQDGRISFRRTRRAKASDFGSPDEQAGNDFGTGLMIL